MELKDITCDSCGAPVTVPNSVGPLTCEYCGSQLQIHRSEREGPHRVADEVRDLNRNSELASLDREWERNREALMVPGKHGSRHAPSSGLVVGYLFASLFGVAWTVVAFTITSGAPDFGPFRIAKLVFPMFGLFATTFGLYSAITTGRNVRRYKELERDYEERRKQILNQTIERVQ